VLQFGAANIDMGIFDAIVTRTFTNAGCIKENIGNAWTALDNLTQTGTVLIMFYLIYGTNY
jgi:hypothetical protein